MKHAHEAVEKLSCPEAGSPVTGSASGWIGSSGHVWLDATSLKQRQSGRIISVAVIIAVAANTEGRPEIIGLNVSLSRRRRSGSTSSAR